MWAQPMAQSKIMGREVLSGLVLGRMQVFRGRELMMGLMGQQENWASTFW